MISEARPKPEVKEKVCKLYVEQPELTARMIAERLGINVSTVYVYAREHGLSRKRLDQQAALG